MLRVAILPLILDIGDLAVFPRAIGWLLGYGRLLSRETALHEISHFPMAGKCFEPGRNETNNPLDYAPPPHHPHPLPPRPNPRHPQRRAHPPRPPRPRAAPAQPPR